MTIKEETVWVTINGANVNQIESNGYFIPRVKTKWGKTSTPLGTKIEIKVSDLSETSNVIVTKICDICGEEDNKKVPYYNILTSRSKGDGLDRCLKCGNNKGAKTRYKKLIDLNSLAIIHPHLIERWDFEKNGDITPYNIASGSHKRVWWKCSNENCDHEWETAIKAATRGQGCPKCWSKKILGENHPRYRHDLTKEERVLGRNFDGYYKWRIAVYERDNFTCQCCGDNKGGNLVAHHKDGYNWCEERRIDISNGVTLCEKCHLDFHFMYGNRYNTEDQYDEWMSEFLMECESLINENINIAT